MIVHVAEAAAALQAHDDILILTHRRPDGDTAGCAGAKTVTISREYPVSVPANYTAQLSVVFYKYNMDVDYVATCVGVTSGRRIKIKGKWSGVDAQFVDAVLNLTPIDSSTASSRKIIITKQMLDSGKIIKVE